MKDNKNTKVYGSRSPQISREQAIVCVYGCCPPSEEDEKRKEIENICSRLPRDVRAQLAVELKALDNADVSIIKFLIESMEKAKKIVYIKEKTENIEKFANLNMYYIHNELRNLSDDMLNFVFEIIKAYESDKKPEEIKVTEIPEDFNEDESKSKIIRMAEEIIRVNFQEYIHELVDLFADTIKKLNKTTIFYLLEILKRKV